MQIYYIEEKIVDSRPFLAFIRVLFKTLMTLNKDKKLGRQNSEEINPKYQKP
jgi:hypothetical protein